MVPAVFLFAQWIEYLFHRYLAHRPSKSPFWRLTYVRHTLMHHQFFTAEEPRFADHKDWRVTIFPPFTLVFFTLTTLPFAGLHLDLEVEQLGWPVPEARLRDWMDTLTAATSCCTSSAMWTTTGSCATARSSTPRAATTPRTTTRAS